MAKPQQQKLNTLRASDAQLFKLVLRMVKDKLRWMELAFQGPRKRRRRKKRTGKAAKKAKAANV